MNEEVVSRIRKLISHYGHTISTFADRVGVQRSSISHVLSGRNKPSLDFVLKVIEAYPEVDLYWLLHGKGNFPSTEETETSTTTNKKDSKPISSKTRPDKQKIASKNVKPIRMVIFYDDGTFESFDAKNLGVDS